MKKFLVFLAAILLVFGVVGTASAVPYTWADTNDFEPDLYVGWWASAPYTHDLTVVDDDTLVAFKPGKDIISNYSLSVSLYDDSGRWCDLWEIAYINQPGWSGDGFYNFRLTNQDFGWSLAGVADINDDGILNVEINSWFGDFMVDSSTLVANGDQNPVPEPATMLLLGSGLIGLAGLGRKKFFKKS